LISGSEVMTFGFPPTFQTFAWASPIARETLNLPGITRCGPQTSPPYSITSIAFGLAWWVWCFEASEELRLVSILSIFYKAS